MTILLSVKQSWTMVFLVHSFKYPITKKVQVLIEFIRKSLITTENSDFISSDLSISNKKYVYFIVYHPPSRENLQLYFEELTYL